MSNKKKQKKTVQIDSRKCGLRHFVKRLSKGSSIQGPPFGDFFGTFNFFRVTSFFFRPGYLLIEAMKCHTTHSVIKLRFPARFNAGMNKLWSSSQSVSMTAFLFQFVRSTPPFFLFLRLPTPPLVEAARHRNEVASSVQHRPHLLPKNLESSPSCSRERVA